MTDKAYEISLPVFLDGQISDVVRDVYKLKANASMQAMWGINSHSIGTS